MEQKPIIAVTPLYDAERESLWMLPGYLEGLRAAGALPLILPLETEPEDLDRCLDLADGLLFTGGQDVDPALYGEQIRPVCGALCPARDRLEQALLRGVLERGLPAFGICRGLQLINAALGGSLYQDLSTDRPSQLRHRMDRPYDRACHEVELLPDTPLWELLGCDRLGVNSCHHQGVKDLAPALQPMARAGDGLIEAAWCPSHPFLWAVQWHPEFFGPGHGPSLALFCAFVRACAKKA